MKIRKERGWAKTFASLKTCKKFSDLSHLGFITNPKNGEVKALSVRVP